MERLVKTFKASGAVSHRRFVKFTANDGEVAVATLATDKIAGVVDFPGGAADGRAVDVVLSGPAQVECGGAITPGAFITTDGQGRAVAAAPAAGANVVAAGRLLQGAVSGDIARTNVNVVPMQG